MAQLHLLRNFPPAIDGRPCTTEAFAELVEEWSTRKFLFGSWTRVRPRRADALEDGSVYFRVAREIRFRMPFAGIQPVREFTDPPPGYENHWAITCHPRIVQVERRPVPFLRGWRYLRDNAAPPDLPTAPATGDRALAKKLAEAGLA